MKIGISGLLTMWPLASQKRESSNSWQRILSHKENRIATLWCQFFYTYRCVLWLGCLTLFQESAWNGRECLSLPENREISCRQTIFGLQSGSFLHGFCLSSTWEGVWILIIAFIICYGKVPSVCLNGMKATNLFFSLRYYHESKTFLTEREWGSCLNIKKRLCGRETGLLKQIICPFRVV